MTYSDELVAWEIGNYTVKLLKESVLKGHHLGDFHCMSPSIDIPLISRGFHISVLDTQFNVLGHNLYDYKNEKKQLLWLEFERPWRPVDLDLIYYQCDDERMRNKTCNSITEVADDGYQRNRHEVYTEGLPFCLYQLFGNIHQDELQQVRCPAQNAVGDFQMGMSDEFLAKLGIYQRETDFIFQFGVFF